MLKLLLILTLIAFATCETQECFSSIENLKGSLQTLKHVKSWVRKTVRSQALSNLVDELSQIETECKVCGSEALQLKDQIQTIIASGKQLKDDKNKMGDIVNLVIKAISAFKYADSIYKTCISSDQLELVAATCENTAITLKNQLEQLTHIATWKNSVTRDSVLESVFNTLVNIDTTCQACVGDVEQVKQQYTQLLTDYKSSDWFSLIELAFSSIKSVDSLYKCTTGSMMFVQQSQSCVNVVEGVKSTLSDLTHIKTWENPTSRSNLLGSLVSTVMAVESACAACGNDAGQLKSDIESIISDSKSKNWLGMVSVVFSTIGDADQLYKCATVAEQLTMNVATPTCLNAIESVKGSLSKLTKFSTWINKDQRNQELSVLLPAISIIEENCQQCGADASSLKTEVQTIMDDVKTKNWFGLIGEALTAFSSADDLYTKCVQ